MSAESVTLMDDLIVTLIENIRTLTWFRTEEYDCLDDLPVVATIVDDKGTRHAITRDTMSRGIDVIRRARLASGSTDPDSAELVNGDTGQPLYMSLHHRRGVLAAARDGDGGDLDVIDTSAIAECRAVLAGGVWVSFADKRHCAKEVASRRLLADQTETDCCTDSGSDLGQVRIHPSAGPNFRMWAGAGPDGILAGAPEPGGSPTVGYFDGSRHGSGSGRAASRVRSSRASPPGQSTTQRRPSASVHRTRQAETTDLPTLP
jgi:hypothetical protein